MSVLVCGSRGGRVLEAPGLVCSASTSVVRSPVCWPSTQLRIRIGGDLGVPLARRWAVAWPGDPALGCTHSQECNHVHWGTGWGLGPGGARCERSAGDGVLWWWIAHPNTPTWQYWPWLEDEASACWHGPHDTIVLLFHTKWSPWVGSGERGGGRGGRVVWRHCSKCQVTVANPHTHPHSKRRPGAGLPPSSPMWHVASNSVYKRNCGRGG